MTLPDASTPAKATAGSAAAPPSASAPTASGPQGAARCAVHPVRRAVDACPVCARPRCAVDAEEFQARGCSVCSRASDSPRTSVAEGSELERYIRAALASTAVALLGGVVAAQYVGAAVFAYLTPFVVGVLTAAAAQKAFGPVGPGSMVIRIRVLAAVYAVLGVAFGFALERSAGVAAPSSLLPYLAAVGGVVLWTMPPRPKR